MSVPQASLISRYYILFFEKFIEKIPSIPSGQLSKWQTFKSFLKAVPIPLDGLHKTLTDMFEISFTSSLEEMERLVIPPKGPPSKNLYVNLDFDSVKDESPRQQLSPTTKKGEIVTKNFRSLTHDFTSKPILLNPFLNIQHSPKVPHLNNPKKEHKENNFLNVHRKSESDTDTHSPLIGKVKIGDLNASQQSKFKAFKAPQYEYVFRSRDLAERLQIMKQCFEGHTEIMNTISEKSFEVSTPLPTQHMFPGGDDFSNRVIKTISGKVSSPYKDHWKEPLSPLKRTSIFAKNLDQNYVFSKMDKLLGDKNQRKIIYH